MNYCHAFILCGLLASLLCVEGHAQTTTKRADTLVLRTRSATKKLVPGDSSAVITLPNQGGVLALEGSVSSLPVGTITTISKKAALPEGYLTCDGQAVSRTDYADLYASIGTTYGAGNGSTTFNVPKLIDPYVPRDGLVAWWPFNGNANDEWVRGYNATVYGPVLTTDRFSTPNAAYTFDGVNDYMVVQLLQHRSYTIAAWANHSAQVAQIRPVFQHKNN
jgi:microcystin-dependent protein